MGLIKNFKAWRKKTEGGVDWQAVKETQRIATNVKILLLRGMFPGEMAVALAQGQEWIIQFLDALDLQLKGHENAEEKPSAEASGNGKPADAPAGQ